MTLSITRFKLEQRSFHQNRIAYYTDYSYREIETVIKTASYSIKLKSVPIYQRKEQCEQTLLLKSGFYFLSSCAYRRAKLFMKYKSLCLLKVSIISYIFCSVSVVSHTGQTPLHRQGWKLNRRFKEPSKGSCEHQTWLTFRSATTSYLQ